MIWPQLWACILACAVLRERTRRWVSRVCSWCYEEETHDDRCPCLDCTADEFDHFNRYVRITNDRLETTAEDRPFGLPVPA